MRSSGRPPLPDVRVRRANYRRGVARVFGPQKGSSPEQVERLDAALENYAAVIQRQIGADDREMPGGGASGRLGTGLNVLLGATLHPRFDIVSRYLEVEEVLERADLVLTAEGGLDFQAPRGKIPTSRCTASQDRARTYE